MLIKKFWKQRISYKIVQFCIANVSDSILHSSTQLFIMKRQGRKTSYSREYFQEASFLFNRILS